MIDVGTRSIEKKKNVIVNAIRVNGKSKFAFTS